MESGKCVEMFFNETDGDFGQEYHRRNLPMYQQGCYGDPQSLKWVTVTAKIIGSDLQS